MTLDRVNASTTIAFWGATETVTGSRFVVETAGRRVVVDCGLFQVHKRLRELNWAPFPVDPASIDAVAVYIWQYPPFTTLTGIMPPPTFARDELQADAEAHLRHAVEEVVGENSRVDEVVLEGPVAHSLLRLAAHTQLLVVGARGRGGFTGLLLGSVSQQCILHAPCPVVVVPAVA